MNKNEILTTLCDICDPNKEAMFVIYSNKKKGDYHAIGDMNLIKEGLSQILLKGIAGKESDPKTILAWTILAALRDVYDEGVSIDELLTAFDDDDEDEEDCADCEFMRVCQNDAAIEYRKANGIKKPKSKK